MGDKEVELQTLGAAQTFGDERENKRLTEADELAKGTSTSDDGGDGGGVEFKALSTEIQTDDNVFTIRSAVAG